MVADVRSMRPRFHGFPWAAAGPALRPRTSRQLELRFDHRSEQAVLDRLLRRHPEIPVGILLDPLDWLAGGLGEDLVQALAHLNDLLGLDGDVQRPAENAAARLMQEEAGVRQTEPILSLGRHEDQRAGAR